MCPNFRRRPAPTRVPCRPFTFRSSCQESPGSSAPASNVRPPAARHRAAASRLARASSRSLPSSKWQGQIAEQPLSQRGPHVAASRERSLPVSPGIPIVRPRCLPSLPRPSSTCTPGSHRPSSRASAKPWRERHGLPSMRPSLVCRSARLASTRASQPRVPRLARKGERCLLDAFGASAVLRRQSSALPAILSLSRAPAARQPRRAGSTYRGELHAQR